MQKLSSNRPLLLGSASPRRRQILEQLLVPFVVRAPSADEDLHAGESVAQYLARVTEAKLTTIADAALSIEAGAVLVADTSVVDGSEILGKPTSPEVGEAMLSRLAGRTHEVWTRFCIATVAPWSAARPPMNLDEDTERAPRGFRPFEEDTLRAPRAPALDEDTVRVRGTDLATMPTSPRGAIAVVPPRSVANLLHAETVVTRVTFRPLVPARIKAYVASGEGTDKAGGYAVQGLAAAFVTRIEGSYTNVVGLPACEVMVALERLGLMP